MKNNARGAEKTGRTFRCRCDNCEAGGGGRRVEKEESGAGATGARFQ